MDAGGDAIRAALYRALGNYLARNREDGIFALRELGPGSIPGLTDLAPPEYHLDLLPLVITPGQREAIAALDCVWEDARHVRHRDGWRLVLSDFTTGETLDHVAVRDWLRQDEGARAAYRSALERHGRELADESFIPKARAWRLAQVGFAPVRQAMCALDGVPGPWMVSSGWALDLFLGEPTRLHEDVDVVLARKGQIRVREVLLGRGRRLDAAVGGCYQVWDAPLTGGAHQVHARHPDFIAHLIDLMFTDLDADIWRYRRDPRVTLPLRRARRFTPDGIAYLAPEIVLLFKSSSQGKGPRGKDQADFQRVLPQLSQGVRAWLATTLARTSPGHPWLPALEGRPEARS